MVRVGLVGFGLAGRVFHAPLLSSVEGIELAAVVERSSDEAAARYPGIKTYRSLDEMLRDKSLNLIVLATPSGGHFELAKTIIEAGKDLVIDKPVCPTAAEIAALIKLAAQHNVQLIPFHNRRWDGDFLTIRKLLSDGSLGRIVSYTSNFDRWRPQPKPSAWREKNQPGSGILLDLGPHLIDQALVLFGMPDSVSAEIAREREPFDDADDSFTVRLHYPGMTATLGANCLCAPPRPRFHLRGSDGNFWKYGLDPQEACLHKIAKIDDANWGAEEPARWGTLLTGSNDALNERPHETLRGDYRQFYAGVRDALLGKADPPVRAEDALNVAKVIEAAQLGTRDKRAIHCK
jgi:predicted dehydrogenase